MPFWSFAKVIQAKLLILLSLIGGSLAHKSKCLLRFHGWTDWNEIYNEDSLIGNLSFSVNLDLYKKIINIVLDRHLYRALSLKTNRL